MPKSTFQIVLLLISTPCYQATEDTSAPTVLQVAAKRVANMKTDISFKVGSTDLHKSEILDIDFLLEDLDFNLTEPFPNKTIEFVQKKVFDIRELLRGAGYMLAKHSTVPHSLINLEKIRVIFLQVFKEMNREIFKPALERIQEDVRKALEIAKKTQIEDAIRRRPTEAVDAIRIRNFTLGAKILNDIGHNPATFALIVSQAYNNLPVNLNLVTDFVKHVESTEFVLVILKALYEELAYKEQKEPILLLQIMKSLESEVTNRKNADVIQKQKGKAILKDVEDSLKASLEERMKNAVLSGEYEKHTKLWSEIFNHYPRIFEDSLKKVIDDEDTHQVPYKSLVSSVTSHRNGEQNAIGLYLVFEKMRRYEQHVKSEVIYVATASRKVMLHFHYELIPKERRRLLEWVIAGLPLSVKYAVFSTTVCIKNTHSKEYLISPGNYYRYNQVKGYMVTLIPGVMQGHWNIIFNDEDSFQMRQGDNRYMYVSDKNVDDQRKVFSSLGRERPNEGTFFIEPIGLGGECYIRNKRYNEYLYAKKVNESLYGDVYTLADGLKLDDGSGWEIENCEHQTFLSPAIWVDRGSTNTQPFDKSIRSAIESGMKTALTEGTYDQRSKERAWSLIWDSNPQLFRECLRNAVEAIFQEMPTERLISYMVTHRDIDQDVVGLHVVFQKLKATKHLRQPIITYLAYMFKSVMRQNEYNSEVWEKKEAKHLLEELISQLPLSAMNAGLSSRVCIRSVMFNQYIYFNRNEFQLGLTNNFTGNTKRAIWKIEFNDQHSSVDITNQYYNARSIQGKGENKSDSPIPSTHEEEGKGFFFIEPEGDSCYIKDKYEKYLVAKDSSGEKFVAVDKSKQEGSLWQIENCDVFFIKDFLSRFKHLKNVAPKNMTEKDKDLLKTLSRALTRRMKKSLLAGNYNKEENRRLWRDIYDFKLTLFLNSLQKAIKATFSKVTLDKLTRFLTNHGSIEQDIHGLYFLYEMLQPNGIIYEEPKVMNLASATKYLMSQPEYKHVGRNVRLLLEEVKNGLPYSIKNAVFSYRVCIKGDSREFLYCSAENPEKMLFNLTEPPTDRTKEMFWEVILNDQDHSVDVRNPHCDAGISVVENTNGTDHWVVFPSTTKELPGTFYLEPFSTNRYNVFMVSKQHGESLRLTEAVLRSMYDYDDYEDVIPELVLTLGEKSVVSSTWQIVNCDFDYLNDLIMSLSDVGNAATSWDQFGKGALKDSCSDCEYFPSNDEETERLEEKLKSAVKAKMREAIEKKTYSQEVSLNLWDNIWHIRNELFAECLQPTANIRYVNRMKGDRERHYLIRVEELISYMGSHHLPEQNCYGLYFVHEAMSSRFTLGKKETLSFAFALDKLMAQPTYQQLHSEYKKMMEKVKAGIPTCQTNAAFSTKVCLKNAQSNEYIQTSNDGKCEVVLSSILDPERIFWEVIWSDQDSSVDFKSEHCGAFLNVTGDALSSEVYRGSFYIEAEGDNCHFRSRKGEKYLSIIGNQPGVVLAMTNKALTGSLWQIENCGSTFL